jgi:ABC-type antimicrobial peptide transport system permease subunit
MSASGMRARADVRARPVSLILVTILVGLIGAVSITALSASRRTDSAYARYRAASNEPEAVVLNCDNGLLVPAVDLAAVQRLPEVEASTVAAYSVANVLDLKGRPLLFDTTTLDASVVGLLDPAGASVLAPQLLAGRLPTAADEVAVGYTDPDARRPSIGDTIVIQMISIALLDPNNLGSLRTDPGLLLSYQVHVVGEVLIVGDLTGDSGVMWVSPAFVTAHADEALFCDVAAVQLRGGFEGTPSFLAGAYQIESSALVFDMTYEAVLVSRTAHLDAIVLTLLAGLSALAGVMILGQSLARRTSLGAIDTPVLRALGMTRRQIVWAAALPAIAVAIGGSIIAVGGSIAASAWFPTGVARIVEPDPGIRLDAYATALGVAVIGIATILSVVIPARWAAGARGGVEGAVEYRGAERRSAVASAIARLPLPVSVGAGSRLALEPGHGRTATPVRSAVAGLSVAVALMVAAFGFAASMDHLGGTPSLRGFDFNFGAEQPFMGSDFQDVAVPVILADPGISDLAAGNYQQFVSLRSPRGTSQEAVWGLETIKGNEVITTMLGGRWPQAPGEVALGRETMSALRVEVGDRVTVTVAGTTRDLTVVGVPVFPDFGFGPGLGRGAAMTMDGLKVFYPDVTQNLVLGNIAPSADRDAVIQRLNDEVLADLNATAAGGDLSANNSTLQGVLRARELPLRLSVLFAFAAFATLVHVLITSVRRRRRDLAILQTLGFRRRQVAATIAWQALTLAWISLLIGVPLGILLGRLGWAAFAYRLGVVSEPVISPLSVIAIPVTLVAAFLVSVGPALVARRVRPAEVLKAE